MSVVLERRYHVPRSQVWAGSRGRQSGLVHLHVAAGVVRLGRIARDEGASLCGRRGWYERAAEGEHELADEALCPRCVSVQDRLSRAEASEEVAS